MPESHIDLDAPEPEYDTSPPRTRRPLVFAVVGLLLAGIAAYGLATRPPEPPDTATLVEAEPLWTSPVRASLGEPHIATLAGGVVLVTARRGLAGYDRATGDELWARRLDELIGSPWDGGLDHEAAVDTVTVAGDAVVIDTAWTLDARWPAYHVVDLATGEPRFALEPKDREGWFEARVTSGGLVAVECDAGGCTIGAHDLTDGSELWRLTTTGTTEVVWPARLASWEHHDPEGGPTRSEQTTADPGPSYLLILSHAITHTRVEPVSTATGEIAGSWNTEVDGAYGYLATGEALLDAAPGRLRRVDPADGGELWRRDTLGDHYADWIGGVLVSDGKLLDTDGSRTRWIDLADGRIGPEQTGEHPVVVPSGVGVTSDPAAMQGVDLHTGTPLWRTPMRTTPWDTFRERNAYADESWLVLDGRLGTDQRATRWICAVNLTTGLVRGLPGASAIGYADGEIVTMSFPWERPTEYVVGVVGLG